MLLAHDDRQLAYLLAQIEPTSTLLRVWTLAGGVSAQVTALELRCSDGHIKKLIVRQHGAVDRADNPAIAIDEFRLLQHLHTAGLAVPQPYYLEQPGTVFPIAVIVLEYIEGTPVFALNNHQIAALARYLTHLHALNDLVLQVPFLPNCVDRYTRLVQHRSIAGQHSVLEQHLLTALLPNWPIPVSQQVAVLHGDYWPGNVLWNGEQLLAVIDWEDASIGDPLADLAQCRLELLWAVGVGALEYFTQVYQSITSIDIANLPAWDLCAALRPASAIATWGLDAQTEQRMQAELWWFIEQAIAKLPIR